MLTELAPDLYVADDQLRLPGGVWFPLRMTVIRLPGGGLWLHSPLAASDERVAAVAALGPVEHIVAPNRYHHLFAADWKQRFPAARLLGAPGLAGKRPDLALDGELGAATAEPWAQVIDAVPIAGAPRISETVFCHRPSGTLLCTDLLFHIEAPRNAATRLVLRLVGAHGRLARSRLWTLARKDRAAYDASVEQLLALPFDRLVPCHGSVVERGAHGAVSEALGVTPLRAVG
jgi:hypothetical protein